MPHTYRNLRLQKKKPVKIGVFEDFKSVLCFWEYKTGTGVDTGMRKPYK